MFEADLHRAWSLLGAEDRVENNSQLQAFVLDLDRSWALMNGETIQKYDHRPGAGNVTLADCLELSRLLDRADREARQLALLLCREHFRSVADSPLGCSVTLFRALGFYRQELAHTRALGWLLGPNEAHGFGDLMFRSMLIAVRAPDVLQRRVLDQLRSDSAKIVRVFCEWKFPNGKRADLYCTGTSPSGDWSCVVEAKVDHHEAPEQVRRYESSGDATQLRIFLSTDGRSPSTAKLPWCALSFLDVARAFLKAIGKLEGAPGLPFLRLYIAGVLNDLCGIVPGGSAEELAGNNDPYRIVRLLRDQ